MLAFAAPFGTVEAMKAFARDLAGSIEPNVVVLGLDADEPQIFVTADAIAVGRGVSAGELVRAAVPAIDGRGGGRPEMAQGKGTRRDGLADALRAAEAAVRAVERAAPASG